MEGGGARLFIVGAAVFLRDEKSSEFIILLFIKQGKDKSFIYLFN